MILSPTAGRLPPPDGSPESNHPYPNATTAKAEWPGGQGRAGGRGRGGPGGRERRAGAAVGGGVRRAAGPSARGMEADDKHDVRRRESALAPRISEPSNCSGDPVAQIGRLPLAVAGEHDREIEGGADIVAVWLAAWFNCCRSWVRIPASPTYWRR